MIDAFALLHGEFLTDGIREHLHQKTITVCRAILESTEPIPLIGWELVENSRSPVDFEHYFILFVRGFLDRSVSPFQRFVIELAFLQKLQQQLPQSTEQNKSNTSFVTIGALIQRRLTGLLVQVAPKYRSIIFELALHAEPPLRDMWQTAFRGAASCARVIQASTQLPDVRIYFATIAEDVINGIDLFVVHPKTNTGLAISVKTGNSMTCPMTARVLIKPPVEADDCFGDTQKVFKGTRYANQLTHLTHFTACLVHVGRWRTHWTYDLHCYPEDVACLSNAFIQLEQDQKQLAA